MAVNLKDIDAILDNILARLGIEEARFKKIIPADLLSFGFTRKEAKAWIKQEPNFTRDIIRHRKLTEPLTISIIRKRF